MHRSSPWGEVGLKLRLVGGGASQSQHRAGCLNRTVEQPNRLSVMCLRELGSELATQHKVRHAASATVHISALRAELLVRSASPHHTAEGRSTTEAEVSEVRETRRQHRQGLQARLQYCCGERVQLCFPTSERVRHVQRRHCALLESSQLLSTWTVLTDQLMNTITCV